MSDNIDHRHRLIGDSLDEVNRLIDEAERVRRDLEENDNAIAGFSWIIALPVAFIFLPVAVVLWVRAAVTQNSRGVAPVPSRRAYLARQRGFVTAPPPRR